MRLGFFAAFAASLIACGPFSATALSRRPVAMSSPPPGPSSPPGSAPSTASVGSAETVRYRLRLGDNEVDPAGAHRCYAGCRTEPTQHELLACLSECPGFEITPGASCDKDEGLPRSVCITHRVVQLSSEPDPGLVLLAVVADFALYVGLASACGVSASCGSTYVW